MKFRVQVVNLNPQRTKGQDSEQDKTKRAFLDERCRAVNQHGGFGKWNWVVSFDLNDLQNLLENAIIYQNS